MERDTKEAKGKKIELIRNEIRDTVIKFMSTHGRKWRQVELGRNVSRKAAMSPGRDSEPSMDAAATRRLFI